MSKRLKILESKKDSKQIGVNQQDSIENNKNNKNSHIDKNNTNNLLITALPNKTTANFNSFLNNTGNLNNNNSFYSNNTAVIKPKKNSHQYRSKSIVTDRENRKISVFQQRSNLLESAKEDLLDYLMFKKQDFANIEKIEEFWKTKLVRNQKMINEQKLEKQRKEELLHQRILELNKEINNNCCFEADLMMKNYEHKIQVKRKEVQISEHDFIAYTHLIQKESRKKKNLMTFLEDELSQAKTIEKLHHKYKLLHNESSVFISKKKKILNDSKDFLSNFTLKGKIEIDRKMQQYNDLELALFRIKAHSVDAQLKLERVKERKEMTRREIERLKKHNKNLVYQNKENFSGILKLMKEKSEILISCNADNFNILIEKYTKTVALNKSLGKQFDEKSFEIKHLESTYSELKDTQRNLILLLNKLIKVMSKRYEIDERVIQDDCINDKTKYIGNPFLEFLDKSSINNNKNNKELTSNKEYSDDSIKEEDFEGDDIKEIIKQIKNQDKNINQENFEMTTLNQKIYNLRKENEVLIKKVMIKETFLNKIYIKLIINNTKLKMHMKINESNPSTTSNNVNINEIYRNNTTSTVDNDNSKSKHKNTAINLDSNYKINNPFSSNKEILNCSNLKNFNNISSVSKSDIRKSYIPNNSVVYDTAKTARSLVFKEKKTYPQINFMMNNNKRNDKKVNIDYLLFTTIGMSKENKDRNNYFINVTMNNNIDNTKSIETLASQINSIEYNSNTNTNEMIDNNNDDASYKDINYSSLNNISFYNKKLNTFFKSYFEFNKLIYLMKSQALLKTALNYETQLESTITEESVFSNKTKFNNKKNNNNSSIQVVDHSVNINENDNQKNKSYKDLTHTLVDNDNPLKPFRIIFLNSYVITSILKKNITYGQVALENQITFLQKSQKEVEQIAFDTEQLEKIKSKSKIMNNIERGLENKSYNKVDLGEASNSKRRGMKNFYDTFLTTSNKAFSSLKNKLEKDITTFTNELLIKETKNNIAFPKVRNFYSNDIKKNYAGKVKKRNDEIVLKKQEMERVLNEMNNEIKKMNKNKDNENLITLNTNGSKLQRMSTNTNMNTIYEYGSSNNVNNANNRTINNNITNIYINNINNANSSGNNTNDYMNLVKEILNVNNNKVNQSTKKAMYEKMISKKKKETEYEELKRLNKLQNNDNSYDEIELLDSENKIKHQSESALLFEKLQTNATALKFKGLKALFNRQEDIHKLELNFKDEMINSDKSEEVLRNKMGDIKRMFREKSDAANVGGYQDSFIFNKKTTMKSLRNTSNPSVSTNIINNINYNKLNSSINVNIDSKVSPFSMNNLNSFSNKLNINTNCNINSNTSYNSNNIKSNKNKINNTTIDNEESIAEDTHDKSTIEVVNIQSKFKSNNKNKDSRNDKTYKKLNNKNAFNKNNRDNAKISNLSNKGLTQLLSDLKVENNSNNVSFKMKDAKKAFIKNVLSETYLQEVSDETDDFIKQYMKDKDKHDIRNKVVENSILLGNNSNFKIDKMSKTTMNKKNVSFNSFGIQNNSFLPKINEEKLK